MILADCKAQAKERERANIMHSLQVKVQSARQNSRFYSPNKGTEKAQVHIEIQKNGSKVCIKKVQNVSISKSQPSILTKLIVDNQTHFAISSPKIRHLIHL